MKKVITLAFCLYVMPGLFAQHINYHSDSKWFFGVNVGGTWNTTDVKNQTNAGWGFLFGRSFNYGPGRLTSFDLRLRYLKGMWYGQDYDTTSLMNYSPAYMPANLQSYKDNPGYHVNNFQADVHELGLELALHANRLRERTGWDPYIFGGANIVWNQTNGDLINSDSSFFGGDGMYDYNPALLNEAYVNSTLDGVYETAMNQGSENLGWNVDFMPSLGIGIGYYFGPRWSVGLEHKTTFALKDDWDGYEDNTPRWGIFENDIYHYTSGYLRFHIKGGGNAGTIPPPDSGNNNLAPCDLPGVRFIRPASNSTTVEQQVYALRAKVDNVGGRQNIVVRVNGQETSNYFFNESTHELEGNIVLVEGPNTIQIVGTNGCGTTVKDITINYNTCKTPIVAFINPSHDNFNVDKAQYTVSASIANGGTISYTVNGVASTNFYYNTANGSFESSITLREGTNTVQIKASNGCGTDTETVNIVYTDCEDPHIAFLIGNGSVMNVSEQRVPISAHVYGIDNQNSIGFRVNGSNKTFTFNTSTHLLESHVTLVPGQNIIQITAGNNCGTAVETITVNYTPCVQPSVNIILPTIQNSVNTTGTAQVKATVSQIASVNQIQMFVNGIAVAGGSYDANSHLFTHNAPLNSGMNAIQIVVTNDCGSDTESITINFDAPCPEPSVSAITNQTQVNDPNFTAQVVVQNISSANQVQMTLNGNSVTGGAYNASTHVFSGNVVLQEGTNTITIVATNDCGTDNLTMVVVYNKPCDLPVISMINPVSQPITTATPNLTLQATITNVNSANQVQTTVNGTVDQSETFNATSHLYLNGVNLQTGMNTIVISATNDCGTVTQTIQVNYTPCLEPVISIISPTGSSTQNGTSLVQASIQNVTSANQIELVVNGGVIPGTYNSSTGFFQSNVALQQGMNVIQITATNDCGADSKTVTIRFEEPCYVPVVTITSPANGSEVQTNTVQVTATVTHVTAASQIQLVVNGSNVGGGSFNPATHVFTATVSLQEGQNSVVITATNDCGSDDARINVKKEKLRSAPEDKIIICHRPPGNPTNVQQIEIPLSAWPAHQAHGDVLGPCPDEPVEEETITICHHPPGNPTNTQQLEIPLSAWPAHQAHGDTQGPCPEVPVEEETMIICHHPPGNPTNTQQLEIPVSAWPAHQAHGDTEGPCVEMPDDPIDPPVEDKIIICHHPPGNPDNTQQIEIPLSAWPAHQAHGDTQGPCPNDNGNGGQGNVNQQGNTGTQTGTGSGGGTVGTQTIGNAGGGTVGSGTVNTNGNTGTQTGTGSGGGTVGTQTIGNAGGGTVGSGTVNTNGNTGTQTQTGSGGGSVGTQTIGNAGEGTGTITDPAGGTGTGGGNRTGGGGDSDNQDNQREAARIKAEQAAKKKADEEARVKAEQEAKRKAEEEAKRKAAEEAKKKAEEEARVKAEQEAKRKAEEAAKRKAEEEAKKKAAEEAKKKAEEEAKKKAEEEARVKAEQEAKRKAEEAAKRKAEEEAKKKAEEEAKKKAEEAGENKEEEENNEEEEKKENLKGQQGGRGGGK